MALESWKLNDFRILFKKKYGDVNFPLLEEFISTLYWKEWKSFYHAEKSKEIWDNLFKPSVVDFGSKKFQKGLDESVTETEAMIQVLHSIGDILAQIVNLSVLGTNAFPENTMGLFYKVLDHLTRNNIAPDVAREMITFKDSQDFLYLQAFCNTIKHRMLLDVEHKMHIDFTDRSKCQEGLRFKEFTYKGQIIPATWIRVIRDEYRVKIYSMVCDIGIAMNNFLR